MKTGEHNDTYPLECPVSLAIDAGNSFHGVKEVFALGRILDISVDEKQVGLGVNVLHHDLEAVEAPGFSSPRGIEWGKE
jgi:hypothetical protein